MAFRSRSQMEDQSGPPKSVLFLLAALLIGAVLLAVSGIFLVPMMRGPDRPSESPFHDSIRVLDGRVSPGEKAPLVYWSEAMTTQSADQLHVVRLDLTNDSFALDVSISSELKESDGEVTAELQPVTGVPEDVFEANKLLIGINANDFVVLEDAVLRASSSQVASMLSGEPAMLMGPAVSGDLVFEGSKGAELEQFWVDQAGDVQIGRLNDLAEAQLAVSGIPLTESLLAVVGTGRRAFSAVGVDNEKNYLYLFVGEARYMGGGGSLSFLNDIAEKLGVEQVLVLNDETGLIILRGEFSEAIEESKTFRPAFVPVLFGIKDNS